MAQTPAPVPGAAPAGDIVVGSGNYSPIVTDLDKAIEFYGTLLGLTVPPSQTPGPRPYSTDPAVHRMFGVPDAQLRYLTARIPGATFGVEMVEVKTPDRNPTRPRPQDPGGTTLILIVRDISAAFAPLKTRRGPGRHDRRRAARFRRRQQARGVIVADPDGHFVELLQPNPLPGTTAPADSNIIGARVRIAVADTDQTMKVYRDVLQIQPQIGEFGTIPLVGPDGPEGRAAPPDQRADSGVAAADGVRRAEGRRRHPDPSAPPGSWRDAISAQAP